MITRKSILPAFISPLLLVVAVFLWLVLLYACAKEGSPTGGPRDSLSPIFIASIPDSFATDYSESTLEIEFDEYLVFKDLASQLVISPPLEEDPLVQIKHKKVIVDFEDNQLKDSTTYTLDFGDAVTDLNEGNPFKDFRFVFSTGPVIDSMGMGGLVLDAFNRSPQLGVWVMIYMNYQDSTPMLRKPDYLAKTDSSGYFTIPHIRPGNYRIFALQDANSNLLFDLPSEYLAFLDTLITPFITHKTQIDSLTRDSIVIIDGQTDTIRVDSVVQHDHIRRQPDSLRLMLFQQDYKPQYMKDYKRVEQWKCLFTFNRSLDSALHITPLNFEQDDWYVLENGIKNDSLIYWIRDSLIYKKDTLSFELQYPVFDDSLKQKVMKHDTVSMTYRPPKDKQGTGTSQGRRSGGILNNQKEQDKAQEEKKSPFQLSLKTETVDLNKALELQTNFPVSDYDLSRMKLYWLNDTSYRQDTLRIDTVFQISQTFDFKRDTVSILSFWLKVDWKAGEKYRLVLDSAALDDLYGYSHDSLVFDFNTRKTDFYAQFTLTVNELPKCQQLIIQLLNEQHEVLRTYYTNKDTTLTLDFLAPTSYILKAIADENANRKWDTGNYLRGLQPESVYFYPKIIQAKSGWTSQFSWSVVPILPKINSDDNEKTDEEIPKPDD